MNTWALEDLASLNRDILAGERPWTDFRTAFARDVLAGLPPVAEFSAEDAQRLVVVLGLAGASVGRHYQEADRKHRAAPELAFEGLTVGTGREYFPAWFAALALRTGAHHPARDSYASLVRWNVPAVEVRWGERQLAFLPTVFADGRVRSYTGTLDETRFFGLLKASEVLERAVNEELRPVAAGSLDLRDPEAVARVARSAVLLDELRRMNHAFAVRSPQEGLRIGWFMDVFRQFAVHWSAGDVPPSGALDVEALIRDVVVGIALPAYPDHLRKIFPGLLGPEREELDRLIDRPSLPAQALRLARVGDAGLATATPAQLLELVCRYPVLAALHLLLDAHARAGGVHLRLSKQFLFAPQRVRDADGFGDPGVVSNRTGTTGMDEHRLETLTRARRDHVLTALRAVPAARLRTLSGMDDPRSGSRQQDIGVRFLGTVIPGHDLGLPIPGRRMPSHRASAGAPPRSPHRPPSRPKG